MAGMDGGEGAVKLSRKDVLQGAAMLPLLGLVQLTPSEASAAEGSKGKGSDSAASFEVRSLTKADLDAFSSLSDSVGWEDTKFDIEFLLSRKDTESFGAFSADKKLVSMATVSLMDASQQADASDLGWLSYVATDKDYRRKGLARRVCKEALKWIDAKNPSLPIGLFGEIVQASPLYEELGWKNVGKTVRWTTRVDPKSLLRSDSSVQRAENGKLEVPAFVDRISVGSTTAVLSRGKELQELVRNADRRAFGGDRSDALKAWAKPYTDLCWIVKDVNQKKVQAIFDKFSSKAQGTSSERVISFEGFKALSKKTEGVDVTQKQFEGFCAKAGADSATGMSIESLLLLYSIGGNDIDTDYAKVTGEAAPSSPSGLRGYILGRATTQNGFVLGPLWAKDQECATTLLLAAVRGGSVIAMSNDREGDVSFELMTPEFGVGDKVQTLQSKAQVLKSLGFKKGGDSRFMVRSGDQKSFYRGESDNVYAVSSYEFG
eukprot:CAMPEP_0173416144 /NCGR_PEP_ID=MMETSP1356-20130122/85240_1 /TAXON_ID=77927 ORGANISM="Hemiselmis virescens, Strain PCC157" /NCGR_SAMPLE_ID=MMETSP1356 /ASSEMBLY_ACC=CAM_ASM_000847 /LENGTH=488 /DNA_ID=CAMNT_0014378445 /DNA_START=180 /DNA_END=1646 /DNA_ORIENTATION=-